MSNLILVSGGWGYGNIGDDAILHAAHAFIEILRADMIKVFVLLFGVFKV